MDSKVEQIVRQKQAESEQVVEAFRKREAAQQALVESSGEKLEAVQVQLCTVVELRVNGRPQDSLRGDGWHCARGWQRGHDKMQSQFFDLKARLEEERASKQHEAEMASEEVEQAQVSRQRHKESGEVTG